MAGATHELDGRGVLHDGRGIDHPLSPREAHPEFMHANVIEEAKQREVLGWRKRNTPPIAVLYDKYGVHATGVYKPGVHGKEPNPMIVRTGEKVKWKDSWYKPVWDRKPFEPPRRVDVTPKNPALPLGGRFDYEPRDPKFPHEPWLD